MVPRKKQPWSTDLSTLRKSQLRLLQTICKKERQRMLQGRWFVPWGSELWDSSFSLPGAAQPQDRRKSSFLLLQTPLEAQVPACMGCRNSRMAGYHRDVPEIQTQGHRCANPMMEKCPFGEVWDKEIFFFFKAVSRPEIPSRIFSRGDPSSPAALGSGEFNYGKSLQVTLGRKHSPACPLPTKRSS